MNIHNLETLTRLYICGTGKGLGRHIKAFRIYMDLRMNTRKHVFPKLLESPSVLPEDKPEDSGTTQKTLEPIHKKTYRT